MIALASKMQHLRPHAFTGQQATGRSYGAGGDMDQSQLRPAGVVTEIIETTAGALNWPERPPTPDHEKKFRALSVHEPGKIVKHYGTADDPIPDGPYGRTTKPGPEDSLAANMRGMYPTSELGRWKREEEEAVYDRCVAGTVAHVHASIQPACVQPVQQLAAA